MSNGQNQTRVRRSKSGRRAPPRPTTAKQSPAGLVISVALHAGLLAATFYTWSRMVQMPPEESHAIPVELVKSFLDHRDAFAYSTDNPNNPYRYLEPPSRTKQKPETGK